MKVKVLFINFKISTYGVILPTDFNNLIINNVNFFKINGFLIKLNVLMQINMIFRTMNFKISDKKFV